MTREEYRSIAQPCRDEIRKAKEQLELHLARDTKGNKKGFYKYVRNKRQIRKSVSPLPNVGVNLMTHDAEKAEVFNTFFTSAFTGKLQQQRQQSYSHCEDEHWSWQFWPWRVAEREAAVDDGNRTGSDWSCQFSVEDSGEGTGLLEQKGVRRALSMPGVQPDRELTNPEEPVRQKLEMVEKAKGEKQLSPGDWILSFSNHD
ncbi:uncharacterized protein LOC102376026 [Alligator sinensis]|uniref:Uncharacterized protein LOC102376026 n=1 Tax=Alligator sinensis TaxID=38654 RepID=A0A1U7RL03_ALLSI|nr:uncharacterized protein LOC102376026 [Alligator sinensis]